MVKVLYFSTMRESVGKSEETIALPSEVVSVSDLIAFLTRQSPAHARAFASLPTIKIAADCRYVDKDASVRHVREIAFFPPVTGG